MEPVPSPIPTQPNPGGTPGAPMEVDPGGLHSRPEVDYDSIPSAPTEPQPEVPPEPDKETPAPETDPGH